MAVRSFNGVPAPRASEEELMRIFSIVLSLLVTPALALADDANKDNRKWTVELQAGPYQPRIDSQFATSEGSKLPPYETTFGDESPILVNIGFDRHIFHLLGPISLGVTAGFWSVKGEAISIDGSDSEASDRTDMEIYPLAAQLSYRLDAFARHLPIVPTARVGLDYYLWQILDGSGNVANFDSTHQAMGATHGWHYSVGFQLLLDALAEDMARDFQFNAGVQNSFITFEYRSSQIDDFGSANSFRLGDDAFFIGLALDL